MADIITTSPSFTNTTISGAASKTPTIFTAAQAVKSVSAYNAAVAVDAQNTVIAQYQYIFDSISQSASVGGVEILISLSRADYLNIVSVLRNIGYTVSAWPTELLNADRSVKSTVTVNWATAQAAPAALAGVNPRTFTALENLAYSVTFTPQGGVGPYNFNISGTLPTGMTVTDSATQVDNLYLTGTPTGISQGAFNVICTDSRGITQTTVITWAVEQFVPAQLNTDWLATTGVEQILNKPLNVSQFVNDSQFISTLSWADLTGKPVLGTVATSNSYLDLDDLPDLTLKANLASPAFTGTVTGITQAMVGLSNVTNESKLTMFTDPAFTGTASATAMTVATVPENTLSVVNKAYVDSKAFFGLATGIY